MGTRSLTVIVDASFAETEELCVLYRQFDGYLSGHGQDLKNFLDGMRIVNGLSGDRTKVANGAGCLAAQIVAHFKDGPGGFYIHAAGTRDIGEDYIYTITAAHDQPIRIKVENDGVIFDGLLSDFNPEKLEEAA